MGFPAGPLSDAPPSLEGGGVTVAAGGVAPGPILPAVDFYVIEAQAAPNNEITLSALASIPGGTKTVIKNTSGADDLIVNPSGGTEFIDGAASPVTIPFGESRTFTSDLGVNIPPLLIAASWWTQGA